MTEMAKAVCPAGHGWDVYGTWDANTFTPDALQMYVCPTCDLLEQEFVPAENLT